MNRIKFLLVLMTSCVVFVLSGCVSVIPELSEDETEIVTQYMADLLLKYDANYQSALLNEEELAVALEEEKEKAEEAKRQEEEQARLEEEKAEASKADDIEVVGGNNASDGSDSGSVNASGTIADMSGALGLADADFDYLGYEICTQYPNDEDSLYFAMTPTAGKELLILKFNFANVSGGEYAVDMMSQGASFAISVNGESYVPVLTTLLENDLSMLMATIPVESGKEVVLVTEVPAGTTVETIALKVRAGQGGKAEIKL